MHDVFISYSSKERSAADEICATLESNGFACWIAPRNVRPGKPFASEIIKAINDCGVFLLVFSKNSNMSEHIASEVQNGFDSGKTIIPYRLDDCEMSDEMKYFLARKHWIVTRPDDKKFPELISAVKTALGPKTEYIKEEIKIPPAPISPTVMPQKINEPEIISTMTTRQENSSLAYIKALSGSLFGKTFEIDGSVIIGRDESRCAVVYPVSSAGVSGVHCEIYLKGGTAYLKDLGSSYGTFLDSGTRLAADTPRRLTHGDRFYVANKENMFEVRYSKLT